MLKERPVTKIALLALVVVVELMLIGGFEAVSLEVSSCISVARPRVGYFFAYWSLSRFLVLGDVVLVGGDFVAADATTRRFPGLLCFGGMIME